MIEDLRQVALVWTSSVFEHVDGHDDNQAGDGEGTDCQNWNEQPVAFGAFNWDNILKYKLLIGDNRTYVSRADACFVDLSSS